MKCRGIEYGFIHNANKEFYALKILHHFKKLLLPFTNQQIYICNTFDISWSQVILQNDIDRLNYRQKFCDIVNLPIGHTQTC